MLHTVLSILCASAHALPAPPVTLSRTVLAMGTELSIRVSAGDRAAALSASEAVIDAVRASEQRLSTWTPDSELSRLNRARPGQAVPISAPTAEDLGAALSCTRLTDGYFAPTVGPLVSAWRLRSRDSRGSAPPQGVLRAALKASAPDSFRLEKNHVTRVRADAILEEGGFAKGAALDDALEAASLAGATELELNFGGQIAVKPGTRTSIAIAHPRRRSELVAELSMDSGSLSTSGNGERGAHILDPRTGKLTRSSRSVSVLAPSGLLADCLSTALLAMGPEASRRWSRAHPEFGVLSIEPSAKGLQLLASCSLRDKLRLRAPGSRAKLEFDCPQTTGNDKEIL